MESEKHVLPRRSVDPRGEKKEKLGKTKEDSALGNADVQLMQENNELTFSLFI
jgi:hypothetical protein